MAARARLTYRGQQSTGSPSLVINEVLPYNATLLQTIVHMDAASVTGTAPIEMRKVSGVSSFYDCVFDSHDPSVDGAGDKICKEEIEFLKGDRIQVAYANPDNLDIGYELIFKEAD